MSDSGVFSGLARSPFLADVGEHDRSWVRIVATIAGGIVVGAIAAFAALILVLILWTVLTGHGSDGIQGIGRIALALREADGRDLGSALLVMIVAVATNVPFALAFVALAGLIFHRRFSRYLTASRTVRWRLVVAGLLMSAVAIAPLMILDRLVSKDSPALPLMAVSPQLLDRVIYALAATLLLIPAAAAEEMLFRGWMLRQVAAFTKRPAVLIIVTALAFSALHGDFSPAAFLTRALMGAGFAYMTLRLGGVEFSTGAHAANNILIVLFAEPLTLKTIAEPSKLTVGSVVEDVVLIAGYILITEAVARSEALRRWAGVRLDEVSASVINSVPRG